MSYISLEAVWATIIQTGVVLCAESLENNLQISFLEMMESAKSWVLFELAINYLSKEANQIPVRSFNAHNKYSDI